MADLQRLSITMEDDLYQRMQALLENGTIKNRSKFFRDLVRNRLVELEWEVESEVVGSITIVYDHHRGTIQKKLTSIQHDFGDQILANTHVHLTHSLCLEVIIARGQGIKIRELANRLGQVKGVVYSEVSGGCLHAIDHEELRHAHS